MRLAAPVPILRSFDEALAHAFYVEWLGFSVDWTHRFDADAPLYQQLSRGGCVFHLSEHHGDATPGAALRIVVDDLDAFARELAGRPHRGARPGIEAMPWGTRDLKLTDPFGNRLIFTDG